MKKILLIIFILSSTSIFAQDCRDFYQTKMQEKKGKIFSVSALSGFGTGYLYWAVATSSSVAIPYMVGAVAISGVVGFGIEKISEIEYKKMIRLITQAYDYNRNGKKGKLLLKLERKLNRNGVEIDMPDLVNKIIDGNITLELCKENNSFRQYKRSFIND